MAKHPPVEDTNFETITDREFHEENDIANQIALPPHNAAQNGEVIRRNHAAATSSLPNSASGIPAPADDDLPDEVKANLLGYENMKAEGFIRSVLAEDKPMDVDKIILALWYNHKFTEGRAKLQARLRAMAARGDIYRFPNQRGTYKLTVPPQALVEVQMPSVPSKPE